MPVVQCFERNADLWDIIVVITLELQFSRKELETTSCGLGIYLNKDAYIVLPWPEPCR